MCTVGNSCSVNFYYRFADGTSKYAEDVTFTSSNPSVVRVDNSGNMWSVGAGFVTVTATSTRYKDAYGQYLKTQNSWDVRY